MLTQGDSHAVTGHSGPEFTVSPSTMRATLGQLSYSEQDGPFTLLLSGLVWT